MSCIVALDHAHQPHAECLLMLYRQPCPLDRTGTGATTGCRLGQVYFTVNYAMQVLDTEEALGVSRAIPIAIKGEAHDIHVDIKFPQDNLAGVDFGPLRVVDDCVKQLVLRNTEKYEVKFDFAVRSEEVKRLVTIFPEDGAVLPNKEVVIMVSGHNQHLQ